MSESSKDHVNAGLVDTKTMVLHQATKDKSEPSDSQVETISTANGSESIFDIFRNFGVFSPAFFVTDEEKAHIKKLLDIQANAIEYQTWFDSSKALDDLLGHNHWKDRPESTIYDYKLIQNQLNQLQDARKSKDHMKLLYLIRTIWSRNIGNIGDTRLFDHSFIGTKRLIEDYLKECKNSLQDLVDNNNSIDDKELLSNLMKTRQSFGRTALLLSGGGTIGLLHSGVLKVLVESELLPHIISGSSAGSIVAGMLCTHTDDELLPLFEEIVNSDLNLFNETGFEENCFIRVSRFLKHGTFYDNKYINATMETMFGSLTFLEAYNRTHRILNITVSSSDVYEIPKLLNYLTAPNVLIRSAACASCSVPFLFPSTTLLAKDPLTGKTCPWSDSSVLKYIDGSVDCDIPMARLAEIFNVNHFIVSQVNPHVSPFMAIPQHTLERRKKKRETSDDYGDFSDLEDDITSPGSDSLKNKMCKWWNIAKFSVINEAVHGFQMINEVGIAKNITTKFQSILSQRYKGDITILPGLKPMEVLKAFQNPTGEYLRETMLRGEVSTWPMISLIENHMSIELALNKAIHKIRARLIPFNGKKARFTQSYASIYNPIPNDNHNNGNNNNTTKNNNHRYKSGSNYGFKGDFDDDSSQFDDATIMSRGKHSNNGQSTDQLFKRTQIDRQSGSGFTKPPSVASADSSPAVQPNMYPKQQPLVQNRQPGKQQRHHRARSEGFPDGLVLKETSYSTEKSPEATPLSLPAPLKTIKTSSYNSRSNMAPSSQVSYPGTKQSPSKLKISRSNFLPPQGRATLSLSMHTPSRDKNMWSSALNRKASFSLSSKPTSPSLKKSNPMMSNTAPSSASISPASSTSSSHSIGHNDYFSVKHKGSLNREDRGGEYNNTNPIKSSSSSAEVGKCGDFKDSGTNSSSFGIGIFKKLYLSNSNNEFHAADSIGGDHLSVFKKRSTIPRENGDTHHLAHHSPLSRSFVKKVSAAPTLLDDGLAPFVIECNRYYTSDYDSEEDKLSDHQENASSANIVLSDEIAEVEIEEDMDDSTDTNILGTSIDVSVDNEADLDVDIDAEADIDIDDVDADIDMDEPDIGSPGITYNRLSSSINCDRRQLLDSDNENAIEDSSIDPSEAEATTSRTLSKRLIDLFDRVTKNLDSKRLKVEDVDNNDDVNYSDF